MTQPSLPVETTELVELVRELVRLKSRLKMLLPANLAQVKGRLDELRLESKSKGPLDYALIYNIGVLLSRESGSLTMGELSKALDVPLSTATRIVDWLVESGYVRRLSDPEDRRIVRVALTEAGRELYKAVDEFLLQRIGQILLPFSPEERASLVYLLQKLIGILGEPEE